MSEPANLEPTATLVMLCAALARVPRHTGNVNVLLHTLRYFSDRISDEERAYCIRLIERYRHGHATLSEPHNPLRSWVIRFLEPYRMNQSFFAP